MTTAAILPFIHAQGSWGEIGHQVGQMFQPAIQRHLEAWTRHVVAETGSSRDAVEAAAAAYARPIQDHTPFLWEELDGMSRGSGIPISRLLILQARAAEGTTFAITGQRSGGVTLIGQNVDLVPFVAEYGVVIRQMPKGCPAALLCTSAGLLGHIGINEAGVGVITSSVDDPAGRGDGLPSCLLSRLALREETAEAARTAVLAPPRAASRNLLIADDRGTLLDVEASGTEMRRERFEELLRSAKTPLTVANIQEFCRDHENAPHNLCAHPFPGRSLETVASVIGDLTNRELHATKGAPCRVPYASYTLATCRTGALSVTVRDGFQPAFSE